MLAVFGRSVAKPPKELSLPVVGNNCLNSTEESAEIFRSWRSDCTFYHLSIGNFLALSHQDENPTIPRSVVVMDDIFCIFSGALHKTCEMRRHYGLSRQATEAMIIVEAHKALRDRAPYPPDQVVKELEGKFSFILFDSKASTLFLARDRDGSVQLYWGTAGHGALVCTDDPNVISAACGKRYAPFPPGCIFMDGKGLMSFDHPLNKVRRILREDDDGNVSGVIFPRTGSAANWANATAIEGE